MSNEGRKEGSEKLTYVALFLHLLVRHVTFVILSGLLHRHLAGKVAWCDTVNPQLRLLEFRAHELGKVDCGALSSVIGKMSLRVTHQPGHAGNDND